MPDDDDSRQIFAQLSAIQTVVARIDERLTRLNSDLAVHRSDLETLRSRLDTAESKIDRAAGALSTWRIIAGGGAGVGGGSLLMQIVTMLGQGG